MKKLNKSEVKALVGRISGEIIRTQVEKNNKFLKLNAKKLIETELKAMKLDNLSKEIDKLKNKYKNIKFSICVENSSNSITLEQFLSNYVPHKEVFIFFADMRSWEERKKKVEEVAISSFNVSKFLVTDDIITNRLLRIRRFNEEDCEVVNSIEDEIIIAQIDAKKVGDIEKAILKKFL